MHLFGVEAEPQIKTLEWKRIRPALAVGAVALATTFNETVQDSDSAFYSAVSINVASGLYAIKKIGEVLAPDMFTVPSPVTESVRRNAQNLQIFRRRAQRLAGTGIRAVLSPVR